ncbi:MAG: HEAT repeat domain-containing protein [Elusimicrobia bacterium]|nr:HEAT repeat domain-containing protein [Elusimicrobiota bacterium]
MNYLAAGLWLLTAGAGALPASTTTLKGVDVYRSASLDRPRLAVLLGQRPELYVSLLDQGRPAAARARALAGEMLGLVRGAGDFSYAEMASKRRVRDSHYELFLTFDVVDVADAARRMPFLAAPAGRPGDPGGLLERWRRYAAVVEAERARGEPVLDRPACPAFYCPWVSRTPELRAFESVFSQEVPARVPELARALASDADPEHRAAAAYLLSYSTSAADAARLMTAALRDSDEGVRLAALSVLADMAGYLDRLALEIDPLLPVLDYPSTADRARALAVFAGLARRDSVRAELAKKIGPAVARLNRCLDPDVSDLAYTILAELSGKDYARGDFDAWDRWAAEAANPK